MVAVIIETVIETVNLTETEIEITIGREEIVTRTGTLMVAIVEIGATAAAQHHHGAVDATRLIIGVVEAIQEVPPEVVVQHVEVGITILHRRPTPLPQLQLNPRLVGKGII